MNALLTFLVDNPAIVGSLGVALAVSLHIAVHVICRDY